MDLTVLMIHLKKDDEKEHLEDEAIIANLTGQNQNSVGDEEDEEEEPSQKVSNKKYSFLLIDVCVGQKKINFPCMK